MVAASVGFAIAVSLVLGGACECASPPASEDPPMAASPPAPSPDTSPRSLDLAHQGLDAAGLQEALQGRDLSQIERLQLRGNPLGPAGARLLATLDPLPALTTLGLSDTGIGDEGLSALAEGTALPALEVLDLSDCGIHPAGLAALARAAWAPGLHTLDLRGNDLEETPWTQLFDDPPHWRRLRLSQTRCGDDCVARLARSHLLQELSVLDLGLNDLGPEGTRALARSDAVHNLTRLAIEGAADLQPEGDGTAHLGAEGARALAESPHLAGLVALDLPTNAIGDAGAAALARSPHLHSLEHLDLHVNDIGDDGARAFLREPALPALRALDLRGNDLSPETRAALRERFGEGFSPGE